MLRSHPTKPHVNIIARSGKQKEEMQTYESTSKKKKRAVHLALWLPLYHCMSRKHTQKKKKRRDMVTIAQQTGDENYHHHHQKGDVEWGTKIFIDLKSKYT